MSSHTTANGDTESAPLLGPPGAGEAETGAGNGRVRRGLEAAKTRWAALGLYRVVLVVLLVAVVLLGALWPRAPAAALCLTPACVQAASEYLTNLSPNYQAIDPCTDFEEYVCGGWRGAHDLRADQGMVDVLSVMADRGATTLRHILEGAYPGGAAAGDEENDTDRRNFADLKRAYDACMDVDAITARGLAPVADVVAALAAVLNASSSSSSSSSSSPPLDDYSEAVVFLARRGIPSFVHLTVGDDDKDPASQIVRVAPMPAFGLPSKEYFDDAPVVAQYQAAVAHVLGALDARAGPAAAVLGGAGTATTAAEAAAAVVQLEARLSQAAPDKADMDDFFKSYTRLSVAETAALLPQVGLGKVLGQLAPAGYVAEAAVASFPAALANVSQIVAAAPAAAVRAFLFWRVAEHYGGAVLGPEVRPWQQFQNVLQGKAADAEAERWRTCVAHVGGVLGWVLSRFFVAEAFPPAAKAYGHRIVADIKAAYIRNFAELPWLDAETAAVAAAKVRHLDQKVGYPEASPDVLDAASVRAYYAGLNVSGTGFFDNAQAADGFRARRRWAALGRPTDMQQWSFGMTAATVNAYYNPPHNEMVFPAGILQFPLFSAALPGYVNYGAFGAVAGHELSHAFDNNGGQYDVQGRLVARWWSNASLAAFEARAQCFVDEFDRFVVVGKDGPLHVRGRQTLGENIADSGGLEAARRAWDAARRARGSGPELSLPGLEAFTHEQLFYVAYGNVWCSQYRPAMLSQRVTTNEHAPDMVRIRGTVLNSRGFREAFHCPEREPTCKLW